MEYDEADIQLQIKVLIIGFLSPSARIRLRRKEGWGERQFFFSSPQRHILMLIVLILNL